MSIEKLFVLCLLVFVGFCAIVMSMGTPPTATSNSSVNPTQGFQFLPPAHYPPTPDLHLAPQHASPAFQLPHTPALVMTATQPARAAGQPVGLHPANNRLFVSLNCFPQGHDGRGVTLCVHTLPGAVVQISVMYPDFSQVNDASLGCCVRADRYGNASWSFVVHTQSKGIAYYSVTSEWQGQIVTNDRGFFIIQ